MFKDDVICYVINLDRDTIRWERIHQDFEKIGITPVRISAVWGADHFDSPLFSPHRFFYAHGRDILPGEIGCFLSHLNLYETFLQTDKEWAVICEDDIAPLMDFVPVLEKALLYSSSWDILRLIGTRSRWSLPYRKLTDQYQLCTSITGMTSTAAYMINRRTAQKLLKKLVPFYMPADCALFCGWIGIREASLFPWIACFNEYTTRSTIGRIHANSRLTQVWWMTSRIHRLFVRSVRYSLQTFRALYRFVRK